MPDIKAGPRRRRPTAPGPIIGSNLDALGLSLGAAAPLLGTSKMALSNIINEKTAVSAEMALRFGKFLGTGPDIWLKMQADVDLWDAGIKLAADLAKIKPAPQPD